jgi:hypothetical protein
MNYTVEWTPPAEDELIALWTDATDQNLVTATEVLAKVLLADPRPPRKRVPAIPRDLERICLTCLAKEPHERYPTGKHLADDLDRFARGEPISVRPAGQVERGYKWVMRNKVVASAMTAVSLVLVIGSIVSLAFGFEAQKQADRANGEATRANGEAERADREAADAIRERNAAVALRNDLAEQTKIC